MKTLWNSTNYNNDLKLTRRDAESCNHSGPCDADVEILLKKPYIKRQLAKLDPTDLRTELYEFGAWTDEQLNDHTENLTRWLWISAGDCIERR